MAEDPFKLNQNDAKVLAPISNTLGMGGTSTLRTPAASSNGRVYDWMGNDITPPPPPGPSWTDIYGGLPGQANPVPNAGTRPPATRDEAEGAVRMLAGDAFASAQGRLSPYPGAAPIAPSAETLQAQQMVAGAVPGMQQAVGQMNDALGTALGAADVGNNQYLREAIDAAIRPITERTYNAGGAMSQIRSGAQLAGATGSSRQGVAEGLATQGYQQAVGDTSAKMMLDAYTHGLDTSIRGLGLAPQTMQAGLLPAQATSAVGQQKEAYATDLANFETDKRMWDINAPWQNLGNYANIVYGNPATVLPGQTNDPRMPVAQRNLTLLGAGAGYLLSGGNPMGAVAGGMGGNLLGGLF